MNYHFVYDPNVSTNVLWDLSKEEVNSIYYDFYMTVFENMESQREYIKELNKIEMIAKV